MSKKEAEAIAEVLQDREEVYLEKLVTKEDVGHLREYMEISLILMTIGFIALGLLMAYFKSY